MCIWIDDFSGQLVPLRRPAPRVDCPHCHGSGVVFTRTHPALSRTMPCHCAAGERWAYLQDESERAMYGLASRSFLEWWLNERQRARAWAVIVDTSRWGDYADARYEQQTAQVL